MISSKRILGIDYGSKRIGISISDPLNIIAKGLTTIHNTSSVIMEIKNLLEEYNIDKIVVGKPLTLKGNEGIKADEVNAFIATLKNVLDVEIVEWDERFTSQLAHQTLHEMGVPKRKRQSKEIIDEMAAAIILQSYLNSQKR